MVTLAIGWFFKLDTKGYSDVSGARSTLAICWFLKLNTKWYIDGSGARSTRDGETGNLSPV